ncbi:TetR/AcrR family transcriptional regulator [Bacillus sp. FJAT-49736]|uniref:TetR/AcrR family transcriptional regulator n=1 Tax=Bacillus sp. FJAT-49736 TaxID=2833582 RepID=UPI001BCA5192|nr:TetR/AcrR family transcriptional regulator [Bacillus sp. FJAT-49736]MBS4171703.1 TetR/AcrR family transcriptional regulator [Bacillus sp. FJAT-49736]
MTGSTERNYFDMELELIQNPTKIKILDTSIYLFSRNGFNGVSIRDISREVGIKESSVYKHFKNKKEILETIFLNFRKEAEKICPPVIMLEDILATMSPKQFLEKGLLNFMDHINNPIMRKIWRIIYIEQYRDPLAREIYLNDILSTTINFLEKAFRIMQDKNQIPPLDPRTLAVEYQYPIFTMITEYILLSFDNIDTSDVERKMSNHIEFFCKAIL